MRKTAISDMKVGSTKLRLLALITDRQILIAAISAIVLATGVLAGWMLTTRGWFPGGGGENRAPSLLAGGQRSGAKVDLHTGFSAIAKAVIPTVVTTDSGDGGGRVDYAVWTSQFLDRQACSPQRGQSHARSPLRR
jgi:hypothetical protein